MQRLFPRNIQQARNRKNQKIFILEVHKLIPSFGFDYFQCVVLRRFFCLYFLFFFVLLNHWFLCFLYSFCFFHFMRIISSLCVIFFSLCVNTLAMRFMRNKHHCSSQRRRPGCKFPTYPMISSLLPIRADLKYDVTATRKFKN